MANTLSVKVSPRKEGQDEWYEGTVSITGVKPTKLCRKSDGSTKFATRSSITGAARNLAQSLGYAGVDFGEAAKISTTKTPVAQVSQTKVAAKKSAIVKSAIVKSATVKSTTVKS